MVNKLILGAFLLGAFLMGSNPVVARSPDRCQILSEVVMQFGYMRDAGVTDKEILAAISFHDTEQGKQASKEIPAMIKDIYAKKNAKRTPEELAVKYYQSCLGLPDWPGDKVSEQKNPMPI